MELYGTCAESNPLFHARDDGCISVRVRHQPKERDRRRDGGALTRLGREFALTREAPPSPVRLQMPLQLQFCGPVAGAGFHR